MGIPDLFTCLLWNLYSGQEATVRTGYGTMDWFQIGKEVHQSCILSPCLFNLYAEYIMQNAGLDEAQAEIKIVGEISITTDIRWHHPYGRKWRGTEEPLDEGERRMKKLAWNTTLKKLRSWHPVHHFMANRWETKETVTDYFLGLQNHWSGDCSHELKRLLLLGTKAMTNLDAILKSRDITLPTKVHLVKAMVFPVVMYGCESWTIKKAECWRIDAFELWCWRRLLRVSWTARRSN